MQGVIAPKPTTYNGIEFRSRLEAKWAVCLDWYSFISRWEYEPQRLKYDMTKFGGDYWLPDFYFVTGYLHGLLEVKPAYPSANYLSMLAYASTKLEKPVFVGFGDFYNTVPRIMEVDPKDPHKDSSVSLSECQYFPRVSQAIQIAAYYRFDLANQPTAPWRTPVRGELASHLSRWTKTERKRNCSST